MSSISIWKTADMECAGCEAKIERELKKLSYVENAEAEYVTGTVTVFTKTELTTSQENELGEALLNHGYQLKRAETALIEKGEHIRKEEKAKRERKGRKNHKESSIIDIILILLILYSVFVILNSMGLSKLSAMIPAINDTMGYGMLFVIGILTSFHCIGMCGGITLIQNVSGKRNPDAAIKKNLLYHIGRVISYTSVGALAGGMGTVLSIGIKGKGILSAGAGIFMVIMGLSLLSSSTIIRRLTIRIPKPLAHFLDQQKQGKSSFVIGLLNGLMPCGPLQAIQLVALTSGSIVRGALSMFFFSIGTVPLLFLFGFINGRLGAKFRKNMLAIQAALVILMGFSMTGNGLALTGILLPGTASGTMSQTTNLSADGYQYVTAYADYGSYESITVQKGIPVRLTLIVPPGKLNGCNNEIIIPEYNITTPLKEGENTITFTPEEEGTYPFSCWMGMIRGIIKVTA